MTINGRFKEGLHSIDDVRSVYNMEIKLGKRLQVLRRERGLTQEDIAGIFNVTNQSVSKWENDLACPDISLLPEIADYFKITNEKKSNKKYASKPLKFVHYSSNVFKAVQKCSKVFKNCQNTISV